MPVQVFPAVVGNFGPSGLNVNNNNLDNDNVGMAAAFSCGTSPSFPH